MKKKIYFSLILWTLLILAVLSNTAFAQILYDTEASSNGFVLRKVVTNTTPIESGQTFLYSIHYTIPTGGATNVTITDVLPSSLVFVSFNPPTCPVGTPAPTITLPPVGSAGTVQIQWSSVPFGCASSFGIVVKFPEGITCDSTIALNKVCMTGRLGANISVDFCTKEVRTVSYAHDPWHISKEIVGGAHQSGACDHVTLDSVVTYKICIGKDYGINGHLNLFGAMVYDILPAGAALVAGSPSCGSAMTQSGNQIIWNVGAIPVTINTLTCCTFQVLYPRAQFPVLTQITNQATLNGMLGSPTKTCDTITHTSNQTCIEIDTAVIELGAAIYKYNYSNAQPGCAGKYLIYVCNNGSAAIPSMTITDVVPASLSGLSIGSVSSGLSASLAGNTATATLTTPLAIGQCRYFEINYTIPAGTTPGTVITNCATGVINVLPPINLSSCNTMIVQAPAAKACLWKEVCSPQSSYLPGTTIRYRLRIQNTGGLALTGTAITEVLNQNLEYVGNPSYWSTNAWGAPCQATSNWSGVSLTQTANTLTFNLPSIPATCQDFFYGYCGAYGAYGVPFYYIEFDVKIADTAALGNIPNSFSINGGSITTPVISNTCYLLVVGTYNFQPEKSLSNDGTNWASSGTVTSGSTLYYRLKMNIIAGGVGLRHVTLVDLLPRDNSGGTPKDKLILQPCLNRSSSFDLGYNSTILTTPSATGYWFPNGTTEANVNNFNPSGLANPFMIGCGSAPGTWSSTAIPANSQNIGFYFGSTAVGVSNPATAIFKVKVPTTFTIPDTTACNTFAANGYVRYLINSSLIQDVRAGEMESQKVCVTGHDTVPTQIQPDCCDSLGIGPSIYSGSSFFGHTYTVFNQMHPPSDICSVIISTSPALTYGVPQGGDLFQDGNPRPYLPNYGTINLASYPAHNTVVWEYGIDKNNPSTYTDSIFVIHCNGDTCKFAVTYHPTVKPHVIDITQNIAILDTLHAVSLMVKGNDNVKDPIKFVVLSLLDKNAKFFALGREGGVTVKFENNKRTSKKAIMILDTAQRIPKGSVSNFLMNLVWQGASKQATFMIEFFNDKGEPIGYDSTNLTSSVDIQTATKGMKGDEFELLQSIPNPTDSKATIYYIIGTESDIRLILYNSLGEPVMTISEGFKTQGVHTLDLNTSGLISGSYYLKLVGQGRSTTLPIMIIK